MKTKQNPGSHHERASRNFQSLIDKSAQARYLVSAPNVIPLNTQIDALEIMVLVAEWAEISAPTEGDSIDFPTEQFAVNEHTEEIILKLGNYMGKYPFLAEITPFLMGLEVIRRHCKTPFEIIDEYGPDILCLPLDLDKSLI